MKHLFVDNKAQQYGFTLIELMIVLVVLGILAAIALPNYGAYVMKSRRTEGIGSLNNIQLEQEKFRANNATYGTLANVWGGVTTTDNGHYQLAVTNPTATGYTITATAQNGQVDDAERGTACNAMTLTVNGLNTTRAPAICWGE